MIIELHNYIPQLLLRVFSFFGALELILIQPVNKLFRIEAKKLVDENIGKTKYLQLKYKVITLDVFYPIISHFMNVTSQSFF